MLSYILPFLFLILVVVFIHEYGHYYFARKYGVGVTDFSIGFGKEIFGWNDKSTEIPIGVSCRTCDRLDCSQRAFPPLHKKFDVDINSRGVSVYVGDKN